MTAELYKDESSTVQWRVIWFPPEWPHRVFEGTEEAVRKRAEKEAQWNPMVESRTVTLGAWE